MASKAVDKIARAVIVQRLYRLFPGSQLESPLRAAKEIMASSDMSSQPQNKSEMPIAEVVRLADLVNYQDGSVISRTILKRATGTLTLFAFDEGEGLSEHTAAFDAVAHVLEGEAEITVSGKSLRAAAGEAVLLPANQPHSLKALGAFKMLLTMLRS